VYEGREMSLIGFEVVKVSKRSYILWSGIQQLVLRQDTHESCL
jgi:hypothetical protein